MSEERTLRKACLLHLAVKDLIFNILLFYLDKLSVFYYCCFSKSLLNYCAFFLQIPITLTSVAFVPLYGQEQTNKVLALFAPWDSFTGFILNLSLICLCLFLWKMCITRPLLISWRCSP